MRNMTFDKAVRYLLAIFEDDYEEVFYKLMQSRDLVEILEQHRWNFEEEDGDILRRSKKYEVWTTDGYDSYLDLETDDLEEAKDMWEYLYKHTTSREIGMRHSVDIRTNVTSDSNGICWDRVDVEE